VPTSGLLGTSLPPRAITDDDGTFAISIPAGTGFPQSAQGGNATLTLTVRGANGSTSLQLTAQQVGQTGIVGAMTLDRPLSPLPVSIVATLQALAGARGAVAGLQAPAPASTKPVIRLGEDGVCGQIFGAEAAVDRFRYSVFFRLVEPRASVLNQVLRFRFGDGFFNVANRSAQWTGADCGNTSVAYVY